MADVRPRVLLADDHLLFVKSLERLLETEVDVVGTVCEGLSLLEEVAGARPDVVVCDLSMPRLDGVEATRRLVEKDPGLPVVMLSMHGDPAHVRAALQAGARAYVVKHAAPEELLCAIREVLRGNFFLSPAVTAAVLGSFETPADGRGPGPRAGSEPCLTPREGQVLGLVCRGLGNVRIAERLCMSRATVRAI